MRTVCSSCLGEMQVRFLGALLGNGFCSHKITLDLGVSVSCMVLLQLSQDHKGSQPEDNLIQEG